MPVTSGNYASEVLYTDAFNDVNKSLERFTAFILRVAAIVAASLVELDLLRPGFHGSQGDSAYYLNVVTHTTIGYKGKLLTDGWTGARLRAKSGGTSGTTTVGVLWAIDY